MTDVDMIQNEWYLYVTRRGEWEGLLQGKTECALGRRKARNSKRLVPDLCGRNGS